MVLRKNMLALDRGFRFFLGVVILGYAIAGGPWWAYIGIVPLATAAFGYCPFYALIGLSADDKT